MAKRFKRSRVSDAAVDKNFQAVEDSINSLVDVPQFKFIPQVSFAAHVPQTISHGLGVAYKDVIACIPYGAASLTQSPSPDRSKYIVLTASASCVVGLLITY